MVFAVNPLTTFRIALVDTYDKDPEPRLMPN